MRLGTPRLGIGVRKGPFRFYLPLLPGKPKTRRVKVYTHSGCTVEHLSMQAATECPTGP